MVQRMMTIRIVLLATLLMTPKLFSEPRKSLEKSSIMSVDQNQRNIHCLQTALKGFGSDVVGNVKRMKSTESAIFGTNVVCIMTDKCFSTIDAESGKLLQFTLSNMGSVSELKGMIHANAISSDEAVSKANSYLQELEGRSFESPSVVMMDLADVKDGDLYGAVWMVFDPILHNGIEVYATSCSISVRASDGELQGYNSGSYSHSSQGNKKWILTKEEAIAIAVKNSDVHETEVKNCRRAFVNLKLHTRNKHSIMGEYYVISCERGDFFVDPETGVVYK